MTEFFRLPEFDHDMKRLSKDFRSLEEDLGTFTVALSARIPAGLPGIVQIANLGIDVSDPVFLGAEISLPVPERPGFEQRTAGDLCI